MRIGQLEFTPSPWLTVLTLVLLSIFIRLAVWQLERADEKRELLTLLAKGRNTTLELDLDAATQLPRYQQVYARGRYDSSRQVLLDNMPSQQGRAGYRVLTPLLLANGAVVLVDRGWTAGGENRARLPDIRVSENERSIVGRLDELPRAGIQLAEQVPAPGWPKVLSFPTYRTLAELFGPTLAERIVLLDPRERDGFERAWDMRPTFSPERHIAYAVQWFALGTALVVIYLVSNTKRS